MLYNISVDTNHKRLLKMATSKEICENVEIQLAEMSCPFTWELQDLTPGEYEDDDGQDELPILHLIGILVKCYQRMRANMDADVDTANNKLQEAQTVFEDIQTGTESLHVVTVLKHIVNATLCHFLYMTDHKDELRVHLQKIQPVSDFKEVEVSALEGCKSIAFAIYRGVGTQRAIEAATKAIEKDQDNALWHLVLAKCFRRQRREISYRSTPCQLEKTHFEIAYGISKNPVFGIHYAQMRRELFYARGASSYRNETYISNEKKVLEIYKEILNLNVENEKVLLKLALGFIRINHSDELMHAKYCLDKVDELSPQNSTSLHYRGLLYQRCGEYKEALKYFKLAGEQHNFVANLNYAVYGFDIGDVNPIEHLKSMLEEYKHLEEPKKQDVYLHLATYSYIMDDYVNAAKYYLDAIKIDPSSRKLHCFFKLHNLLLRNGIYHFIYFEVLPKCLSLYPQHAGDNIFNDTYRKLRELCFAHIPAKQLSFQKKNRTKET